MAVLNYEGNDYKSELKGKSIVMFWAEWCGPCQMTKPGVTELGEEGVNVILIDVDKNQELSKAEGISAVPTIKLFNETELKKELQGFMAKEQLQTELDAI